MRVIFVFAFVAFLFLSATAVAPQGKANAGPARRIEGCVTDLYGVPWEGAVLRIRSQGAVWRAGKQITIDKETKSDSEGRYKFDDLPEDSYELILLRMGGGTLQESKVTGIFSADKPYRLDFGVEVGATSECPYVIHGTVKDAKSKVINGAKVSTVGAFNQRRVLSATSDESGHYEITICSPGDYVVFANTPKYTVKVDNVTFETGTDFSKVVDFILQPVSERLLNWRKQ